MDYKFNSLYNKVYRSFIRGEYGNPIVPSRAQVIRKIEEITSREYEPVTKNDKMGNIDIAYIQEKFGDIIDDIDVLFDSIEAESRDILDQLTNSNREHRGVKRELRRIASRTKDISTGKLGEEYLKYNYTETFDGLENINTRRSDPVFTDAGVFSISREADNILSLSHYYGTKLQWSFVENYAQVIDQAYVGTTDAATMLDQTDERQLHYRIKTNRATRLRVSTALQLLPNGAPVEINGVTIDVDATTSKGWVRLYYRDGSKWIDVKTTSIQQIVNDKVIYNFPNTMATHIKIEFIKDAPDITRTNDYNYIINNLAVFRGTSKKTAVLYSKPIEFSSYDRETPVITSIRASGDITLPETCTAKLYIAQDKEIQGQFKNSAGDIVYADSADTRSFDPSATGTVFLSDIWNAENTVSGVEPYKSLDFEWTQLKAFGKTGEKVPEEISFNSVYVKPKITNTLFTSPDNYLWGDVSYTGVYLSGWVNTSNSDWALMEPLVDSGILVSGETISAAWVQDSSGNLNPDVYSDPRFSGQWIGWGSGAGYPFNYTIPSLDRTIRFNEYVNSVAGWWRPYSIYVGPSGLDDTVANSSGNLATENLSFKPDFNFNGLDFYKIYKFSSNTNVVESSIKLYSYQERPVSHNSGYYPSFFSWKYKSKWLDEVARKENARMSNPPSNFKTYVIPVSSTTLRPNEEYIVDSIAEVRVHGTPVVLDNSEYQVLYDDAGVITGINLSGFDSTTNYTPSGVSFDYQYQYRVKDEYLSTWTGYTIVTPGVETPTITIANQDIISRPDTPVISNVTVQDMDTGVITNVTEDGGLFTIVFTGDNREKDKHYKITVYCASDESTGFCANNWIPFEANINKTITVSNGIKLVPRLDPITVVDLSTLIYDTPVNNDSRVALITEETGDKFLVVKKPSKDIFPGHYFNSIKKAYIEDYESKIENIGHWIRNGYKPIYSWYEWDADNSGYIITDYTNITYTTGSNGNTQDIYKIDESSIDRTWNNGKTLTAYPNTSGIPLYKHHSTYGLPVNIDRQAKQTLILTRGRIDPRAPKSSNVVGTNSWESWLGSNYANQVFEWNSTRRLEITDDNRGYLFHDTAENLPTFYSITYSTLNESPDLSKKFLYRLDLESDNDTNLTPVVRSLRFTINDKV